MKFALLFAALFLLTSSSATADPENRNLLPLGERASQLGNAGITMASSEAVFFNPANLARLSSDSLAASGATYLGFALDAKNVSVGTGDLIDISFSGFMSIPTSVVSTYSVGDYRLATSVLVPEALQIRSRDRYFTEEADLISYQDSYRESLWLGLSAARSLSDAVHLGGSVFAIRSQYESLAVTSYETVDGQILQDTSAISLQSTSLSATAGITWNGAEGIVVAARVQTPTIGLSGSGDFISSTLVIDELGGDVEHVSVEGLGIKDPLPWDLGLGVSLSLADKVELMVDVNLQLPATLLRYQHELLGQESTEVQLTARASLGLEWESFPKKWLRLGLLYNPSAVPKKESRDGNFAGATLGLAWQNQRTTTSIGGFFLQSSDGTVGDGSTARVRLYGALLSASYQL